MVTATTTYPTSARAAPCSAHPAGPGRGEPKDGVTSVGTVKRYVSTILSRLQVKNRVQAAIVAYEAGLVDDGSGS
jgi:hypothetical protein